MKSTFLYTLKTLYLFFQDFFRVSNKIFLTRNARLAKKHNGERCFLIATGSSLEQIELHLLKEEQTFGMGFIFLHPDIKYLDLKYYLDCEIGPSFDNTGSSYKNWPENYFPAFKNKLGKIFFSKITETLYKNGTSLFLNHEYIQYFDKLGLFDINDDQLNFIKTRNSLTHLGMVPEIDLQKRFRSGKGGISTALLVLIYMGFKEIYLCGAGYSYDPGYELHFYDNFKINKNVGEKIAKIKAKDWIKKYNEKTNSKAQYFGLHEKGSYYYGVFTRELNKESNNYREHQIINAYARSKGVKIVNIMPKGFNSPIYASCSWSEIKKSLTVN
jgi:hypothetical protein